MQIWRIVAEAVVFDTETAGARRAEACAHCVEKRHFSDQKKNKFKHGHTEVDQIQDARRGFHFWNQFADGWPRAFGAHQVDVGAAAHRDNGEQENEHAHAADPVCETAPEQRRM